MTKFNIVAGAMVAAVFAISGVYAINTIVGHTHAALPRVLMIGSGAGDHWQRTLVGARAAAKEFGVELEAELPTPDQTVEQQSELVRKIRPTEFDGVAISMEDPASQVDMINDLASRTKVVTVGKDAEKSKRLCHIGFSQVGAGAKAAWTARRELMRDGQIALLTTAASSGQDEIVRERLTGFQEVWATHADNAAHFPIVVVPVDADGSLSNTLSNPNLALIVALDVEAAESAIKATASWPESERIPIITLDTSEIVLDAIEDGRVSSAVFNDVYEDGYEAVRQLAMYSREDEAGLPTPGCGTFPRNGEIVSRSNVADVRGKLAIPVKEVSGAPQLHLSSAEVNASLLTP